MGVTFGDHRSKRTLHMHASTAHELLQSIGHPGLGDEHTSGSMPIAQARALIAGQAAEAFGDVAHGSAVRKRHKRLDELVSLLDALEADGKVTLEWG